MPDAPETVWDRLERSYERMLAARREYELNRPRPRPELRLMPTGDAAPASGDPLLDRLTAAVNVLEARGGARLTVVRGGDDDAS